MNLAQHSLAITLGVIVGVFMAWKGR